MATRKKGRAKPKGRSRAARKAAPKKKTAARRKPARTTKKVARARAAVKKAAPRRPPAPRTKAPAVEQAPQPKPAPAAATSSAGPTPKAEQPSTTAPASSAVQAAPAAAAGREERVGVVTHFFSHLSVAVVRLESGSLRIGDTVHIRGHTSDFRQRVESMQIEHQPVTEVRAGQEFGLKVSEHAREHDVVYKVSGA